MLLLSNWLLDVHLLFVRLCFFYPWSSSRCRCSTWWLRHCGVIVWHRDEVARSRACSPPIVTFGNSGCIELCERLEVFVSYGCWSQASCYEWLMLGNDTVQWLTEKKESWRTINKMREGRAFEKVQLEVCWLEKSLINGEGALKRGITWWSHPFFTPNFNLAFTYSGEIMGGENEENRQLTRIIALWVW